MKKIIRLNEEKLQRLVEAYLEDLDFKFGRADEARSELRQLITNILDKRNSHQEGQYFMVDLRISSHGGHYVGQMEIRDKIEDMRYSHLVMVDLDLTTYSILYQGTQVDTKYAKDVNNWTVEILNKLGYRFE